MPKKKQPEKTVKKEKKVSSEKKEQTGKETPVIQPGSGRRFLLGCCFPALLLFLLLVILSLPVVWCVLSARIPQIIPREAEETFHFLRYYSSLFYRLTEKMYFAAGGTVHPLERADNVPFARVEIPDSNGAIIAWRIAPFTAEKTGRNTPSETFTFTDREEFLRSLRQDGEYRDQMRFPCLTQYQNGHAVRIRKCPCENGHWLFDCRYVPGKNGQDVPWCGRRLNEAKTSGIPADRIEVYLAGKKIFDRLFVSACYLRGEDGLSEIEPEKRMFYRYVFQGQGESLRNAVRNKTRGSVRSLILQKKMIFGPGAVNLFPDSLIRMAVCNSDLALLNMLLRDEDAIAELTAENQRTDFSLLHAAAMQPDTLVLAKVLPLFSEINLKEHTTGAIPFLVAVMMGNTENVLLFLRREDKQVNAVLPDGSTALHLAVNGMVPNIVEILLNYGANKNLRNKAGETPLAILERKMQKDGWLDHPDAVRIKELLLQ